MSAMRHDEVVVLASGTEISVDAAVGDIRRVMEYLGNRLNYCSLENGEAEEIDGHLSDLTHVSELLRGEYARENENDLMRVPGRANRLRKHLDGLHGVLIKEAEWCEEDVRREVEYFDQRPERMPGRRWEIIHAYTGEVLDEVWASCAVDALASYSDREGFADPREVAAEDPEMDFFYRRTKIDGRLGMIITNYEVYAVEA